MGYSKDSEGYLDTSGFICSLNIWDTGIWEREVRKQQDITEALFDHSNELRRLVKEILIQDFPAGDPNFSLQKRMYDVQDLTWDRKMELQSIPKSDDFIIVMNYKAVKRYNEQKLVLEYAEKIVKIEKKYHLGIEKLLEAQIPHSFTSKLQNLQLALHIKLNQ